MPGVYVLLIVAFLLGVNTQARTQPAIHIGQMMDSARSMPNDTAKVNWLVEKGKSTARYYDSRKEDNPFLRDAIALGLKIKYPRGLAVAYNETGTSRRNRSEYILAADYHEKALKYAEDAKDDPLICFVLNNLGVDNRRLEKLQPAFNYHLRALHIAERINDLRNICVATNSIGNIELSLHQYQSAVDHFNKALALEKTRENNLGIAINLGNLGYAYQGLGKLSLAIEYFKKSLAINQQMPDTTGIVICYNALGAACQEIKDYAAAMEYLQLALKINNSVADKIHLAESYLNIGKLLSAQGKHDEARTNIQESIHISNRWRFNYMLMEAYKALAADYKQNDEFEASLAAQDRSLAYKDSILDEKSTLALAQMHAIYEVDRKDNQIRTLEHDNLMGNLRTRRNVVYTLTLAGFLLMLTIGGFFYIRHRNLQANKQTLQLELRSLRAQMNPHFIFNSLSSIHRYIWSNNQEEASDYLTKFSKLMRMILDNSQHTFISLNKELESLRLYMDLEQLRCNNAFEYTITIDDAINEEDVMIPPMIIQPYVENAIWHGLVPRTEKGRLDINIALNGKRLECTVTDNGIGRKKAMEIKERKGQAHQSMGMKVTEGRIDLIRKINNTKDANITVTDLQDRDGHPTGTRVGIVLPVEFIF
ncbi:tetratricopeptide repeat protein [Chitinophaga pendula]|uniref:tetratricopeptide repeat-containing sensor histidine kinase n=1 Tax=Chitinophaga TaxID=79328 RepID=UPI000BB072AF|nr:MULTISPECIES: tetratricopeptide repeat protein [Chitinophaga]ASZ14462.1 hypothetical protein CK934_27715 [Chitinophaga sp. MD30]UCJ07881.1 tetratricopeptide repeat protein [Chitinophaga pendula]